MLLYLGVVLFLAGVVAAYMSLSSLQGISPAATPTARQLALGPGALRGVPVALNQSSVIFFSYNASARVDFYLANQSAYAAMGGAGANGTGARAAAVGLEGKGIYAVYENVSMASFPYVSGSAAPAYSSNSLTFPAGTYYALFCDRGSGGVNVTASYTALGAAKFDSAAIYTLAYGGISFLLLAVGFIISLAALFMKEKNAGRPDKLDKEAQREYDLLEKKGGAEKGGNAGKTREKKKRSG
jgi:hypothetical protein